MYQMKMSLQYSPVAQVVISQVKEREVKDFSSHHFVPQCHQFFLASAFKVHEQNCGDFQFTSFFNFS